MTAGKDRQLITERRRLGFPGRCQKARSTIYHPETYFGMMCQVIDMTTEGIILAIVLLLVGLWSLRNA